MSFFGVAVAYAVMITNDPSLELRHRATKGELDGDTDPDTVPPCPCAPALPRFLVEVVSLRPTYPDKHILIRKAGTPGAFRNDRVDPGQVCNFVYTV